MSLYAMSDLHLSFANPKPMDIFGEIWHNHPKKIKENWNKTVNKNDTVIVNGDISWSKTMEDFMADFKFIEALNGKKIIMKGNHDYWWGSTAGLNELSENVIFLKNGFTAWEDTAICGTRGWVCPNDIFFDKHDEKIYRRETKRFKASIEAARQSGYEKIIAVLHYPPTNDKKEISDFVNIIEEYKIKRVIYGHLHGENSFKSSLEGIEGCAEYSLVSSDYLNFIPLKIIMR